MQEIIQVDAFTTRRFSGNPAAVCIMDDAADEAWMQNVAAEMNLSETAFLYPEGDGYHLRWFTPAAEVKLCGHATLASAFVLYEDGHISKDRTIEFQTLSGGLTAKYCEDLIQLDFPAIETKQIERFEELIGALGVDSSAVNSAGEDLLVELKTAEEVRSAKPDFGALKKLKTRGVIITAPGDTPEFDFVSRFFAPAFGVDEDPVTGSAHCALATYWAPRTGKNDMRAYQASRRGGAVSVTLAGTRVLLSGSAVVVMRGELV